MTLTIPAGTDVIFNVEDFGVANGHQLRVLAIDLPSALPFVSGAPDALYGCSPFEVSIRTRTTAPVPMFSSRTRTR